MCVVSVCVCVSVCDCVCVCVYMCVFDPFCRFDECLIGLACIEHSSHLVIVDVDNIKG